MYIEIKKIFEKHQEIIVYVFFGGLTTLVSVISRLACYNLGAGTALNTMISWIIAVTFAFFVNKIFVFQNKEVRKRDWFRQGLAFYGARLTTFFLDLGFMLLTVEVLLWSPPVMMLTVNVFILIGNYFLSKFWIFRKKEDGDDVEEEDGVEG
jgi:putative flippase GtrA